jgi:hypothetical protein
MEWLPFPQIEQSGDMIHIGIGQHHRLERAVAKPGVRIGSERGMCGKLLPQVRGSVKQAPIRAVGAYGERGLAARLQARQATPDIRAIATCAVPLRKASPRSRSQNPYEHLLAKGLFLKLSRNISGNFQANILLADLRLVPGLFHGRVSFRCGSDMCSDPVY